MQEPHTWQMDSAGGGSIAAPATSARASSVSSPMRDAAPSSACSCRPYPALPCDGDTTASAFGLTGRRWRPQAGARQLGRRPGPWAGPQEPRPRGELQPECPAQPAQQPREAQAAPGCRRPWLRWGVVIVRRDRTVKQAVVHSPIPHYRLPAADPAGRGRTPGDGRSSVAQGPGNGLPPGPGRDANGAWAPTGAAPQQQAGRPTSEPRRRTFHLTPGRGAPLGLWRVRGGGRPQSGLWLASPPRRQTVGLPLKRGALWGRG